MKVRFGRISVFIYGVCGMSEVCVFVHGARVDSDKMNVFYKCVCVHASKFKDPAKCSSKMNFSNHLQS